MLTTIILIAMALLLFGFVALPLINPGSADPLPPEGDPVGFDLEEEKDALLRAIRELDARQDLSPERREQLRSRYEAKAAQVLKAIDARKSSKAQEARPAAPSRKTRVPVGALGMLAVFGLIAVAMGAYVLPRVGQGTVTTFFEQDLQSAQQLRDLRRAVERDPSGANYLALGDLNWQLGEVDGVWDAYSEAVLQPDGQSPRAYYRLGLLVAQNSLEEARTFFEAAYELDPSYLENTSTLAELHMAMGDYESAGELFEEYLATPGGEDDPQIQARLELTQELGPLVRAVEEDPSKDNLMALGDLLWEHDQTNWAIDVYFTVITQHDVQDPIALGRAGQALFLTGNTEESLLFMERAAIQPGVEPATLLFLGNAYYTEGQYEHAIAAWEQHLEVAGDEAAARVPGLIEDARARLGGEPDASASVAAADAAVLQETAATDGAAVYAAHCASCHGGSGEGGMGPRLVDSRRAANETNVRNAVTYGRGMMPGFQAVLSEGELEGVIEFVTGTLSVRER